MTTPTTVCGQPRGAWRVPVAPGQRSAQPADPPPAHRHTTIRTELQGRAA
jgi:hypothetical protein